MSKHFQCMFNQTSYSLNIISSFISNIAFHIINLYLKVVLYQQVIISIFSKIQTQKREFSPIYIKIFPPYVCVHWGVFESWDIPNHFFELKNNKLSEEEYYKIVCGRISRK